MHPIEPASQTECWYAGWSYSTGRPFYRGSDRTSCLAAGPHDYSSYGCWDYDWLNKPDIDYWALTAYRYITNGFISVNQSSPSDPFAIFPTLYLKSSAGVASGDGSAANPYVIE